MSRPHSPRLARGFVGRLFLAFLFTIWLAPTVSAQEPQGGGLKPVTIGFVRHAYGTWTAKIADGSFETQTGRAMRWIPFDSDAGVAAAMSAGRVDVGLLGAGVAASAFVRGLDLKIFFVMGASADTEGMLLGGEIPFRAGDPKSLQSKVIAVPFGSTAHLRLLQTLRRWGAAIGSVRLVNLQVPQIREAWARHELDAAVVSEPLLGQLKTSGRLVPLAGTGGNEGLLVLAGNADFVAQHIVFLARLVDVVSRADASFVAMSGPLAEDRTEVKSIAFVTGLEPSDVIATIARYRPPTLKEQASQQWLGGGEAAGLVAELKASVELWRWGGRLDRQERDLTLAVTAEPVERALEFQR